MSQPVPSQVRSPPVATPLVEPREIVDEAPVVGVPPAPVDGPADDLAVDGGAEAPKLTC